MQYTNPTRTGHGLGPRGQGRTFRSQGAAPFHLALAGALIKIIVSVIYYINISSTGCSYTHELYRNVEYVEFKLSLNKYSYVKWPKYNDQGFQYISERKNPTYFALTRALNLMCIVLIEQKLFYIC